jgi:hypothetical protein
MPSAAAEDLPETDIPSYYILGREIDEANLLAIHDAMAFTPVVCSIVYDAAHRVKDIQLAKKFSKDVLSMSYEHDDARCQAAEIHKETHQAVLIIGPGSSLTSYTVHHAGQEIYPTC